MRNLDLNLLLVFDVLYQECSVTKAARRLNLTQSAVSHSLRRLRVALNDELFVRGANGLEPTSRAAMLANELGPALERIRDAVASSDFDPATTTRCFTIVACSLYLEVHAPLLVRQLRISAPGAALYFTRTSSMSEMRGETAGFDIAIDVVESVPAGLSGEILGKEPLLWVAGSRSPLIGAPVSAEMLASQPSVQFEVQEGWHRGLHTDDPLFDATIFEGEIRRLRMSSNSNRGSSLYVAEATLAALLMVGTDHVALLPAAVVKHHVSAGTLVQLDVPFETAPETVSLMWPQHLDMDSGRKWLSGLIQDCYGSSSRSSECHA